LSPEDYGIVAIATIIIAGMRRFEDFGVNAALIRRRNLSDRVKANGNTIKFFISFILIIFAFIISPYWANLYNNESISTIIRILSLSFLFNSFIFLDRIVLIRELDFKRQLIPDMIRIVVGSSMTLIFALLGFKFWSIVYGTILGTISRAILLKILVREKIRFQFDKKIAFSLFSFGIWVLLGSLMFWAYTTIDNAFIGKFLGITALGYYAIAYRWGNFATENIQGILSKILFPAFASMKGDIDRIRKSFLKVVEINSIIVIPMTLGLMTVADYFILVVLGEKWYPAYYPLLVLCIFGLFRALQASGGSIFYALNKPKINAFLTAITLIIMLLTIYPAIIWKGILGASIAVTFSFLISFVIQQILLCGLIRLNFKHILSKWSYPMIASLIMSAIILILKVKMTMNFLSFTILIITGIASYIVTIILISRGKILHVLKYFKKV
jgi:PST family polysaccharide transporter/lipopolysaccharide exporter